MSRNNPEASEMEGIVHELLDRVKENLRRVRDVEEENKSMSTSIQSVEERVIKLEEKQDEDMDEVWEEIDDLLTRVMKIENKISKLKDMLENTPQKDEFDEIKNFVDLLSPIESEFMTESEVKSLIKEELQRGSR